VGPGFRPRLDEIAAFIMAGLSAARRMQVQLRHGVPTSLLTRWLGFAFAMALLCHEPVEGARKYPEIFVNDQEKTVEQEMRVRNPLHSLPFTSGAPQRERRSSLVAEVAGIKSSRGTVHAAQEETALFAPRAALYSSCLCTHAICEPMRLDYRVPPSPCLCLLLCSWLCPVVAFCRLISSSTHTER